LNFKKIESSHQIGETDVLKLKKLIISNVGRFVGSHEIVFDGRPNLIQVDALNKNTNGSSGSGKSTIFNSLEYLLGTNSLPSTVLQSRLTKNPLSVEGVFDYDGKNLTIRRSKNEGLTISLDGVEIVSGSNKAAEEKLDEILGIPRDLLRKMIHKRQKEGGFFLSLTPKECHAFLAEVLDLKTWTRRLLEAEQDVKRFDQEAQNTQAALDAAKSALEASKNSLSMLQEPILGWEPSILPFLKNNLERSESLLKEEYTKLEQELSLIEKPQLPPTLSKDTLRPLHEKIAQLKAQEAAERNISIERWKLKNKELSDLESSLSEHKRTIDNGKLASLKIEDIKAKILSIKNGICPTCKREWHQGQHEIDALVAEAKKKTIEIEQAKALEQEIPKLLKLIEDKKKEVEAVRTEISTSRFSALIQAAEMELRVESEKLEKEQQLLNQAYHRSLELVREQETAIRSKFNEIITNLSYNRDEHKRLYLQKVSEYESFQKNLELFTKNKQSLNQAIKIQESQIFELEEKNQKAVKMRAVSAEAVKIIRSYMNSLFQDALDAIAVKATQILSRIPNMATASIYFEGFKETKSGSIKDEVTAILTMDGEINIPIKSMSGGERTAIDLAVDLAVIDMIEEQAGKGLDIFILDEPFDGLDSICREECLQILQAHVTGKKIIVVDHSNETKEMVHDTIRVVRDGQESRICDNLAQ
jgi:DNA repair exonuclease SbcCD ATPase subunit